jgi:teichuronic acid biosynthesis glycosyltransferase TuaC
MSSVRPALVVLSTLFPSDAQPVAGVFVRERMFRVARHLPITVISPQPWFPGQGLVRAWRPDYRPPRAAFEVMDGVEVHRPRFFALPGVLRRLDGWFVALAARPLLRRLQQQGRADILDAHFGYPDGYAGSVLARWSKLPFVLTLRGKEERLAAQPALRQRMSAAVQAADRVISVSSALRDVALDLGAAPARAVVVGNGVDLAKFFPLPREQARAQLGLDADAPVLVSVGTLVERKGFHRVIAGLPALLAEHPKLVLLVVGGAGAEGDWSAQIRQSAVDAGVVDHVRFLGPMKPDDLRVPLSAADVFVLATRYEGWANVFLEAMACGLPVVTTRVGGNAEVVCSDQLGLIVPFDDAAALTGAMADALRRPWDRAAIIRHAQANTWDQRIDTLVKLFKSLDVQPAPATASGGSARGQHHA